MALRLRAIVSKKDRTRSSEIYELSGEQPNELSVREDDLGSEVDGLSEEVETVEHLHENVLLLLLDDGEFGLRNRLSVGVELHGGLSVTEGSNEEPDGTGDGEEDGGEEEGVVVSESLNGGGRGESSGGTGDFVEDVDGGVHSSKLTDVSTDDIGGNDLFRNINIQSKYRERESSLVGSTQPYRKRHQQRSRRRRSAQAQR